MMVTKGQIDASANVLNLGCGNGTTAIWLSGNRNWHVTGVDLSGVRVQNAQNARARLDQAAQEKLAFEEASAADLPFDDASFTRLWSQAVSTTYRKGIRA
ncbi:MAG: class I SAM-dependent methyltransferase [SAR202 cluster bacterium]|nr:class I SAM-dependent methyltransferase [SAR202 cluster bacterium]